MQILIMMKSHLIINKNKITFSQESKIEDIDWKKFGVDYVFECTGKLIQKKNYWLISIMVQKKL
jgi:glyceraldehyde-3-phosphate dehydrogenase/erythrose-4-phosphate dehydrogenase